MSTAGRCTSGPGRGAAGAAGAAGAPWDAEARGGVFWRREGREAVAGRGVGGLREWGVADGAGAGRAPEGGAGRRGGRMRRSDSHGQRGTHAERGGAARCAPAGRPAGAWRRSSRRRRRLRRRRARAYGQPAAGAGACRPGKQRPTGTRPRRRQRGCARSVRVRTTRQGCGDSERILPWAEIRVRPRQCAAPQPRGTTRVGAPSQPILSPGTLASRLPSLVHG